MLNARRKKAEAAAPAPTTTTPTKAAAAPAAAKKTVAAPKKAKVKVEGSMRTIALGRHYKDGHEAILDEHGLPKLRAYFDIAGRGAAPIAKDWDKTKSVPLKDLIKYLNEVVYKPVFGQALRGTIARDLVLGTFDALLGLSEQDYKYKIPNFMRVETKVRAERMAHNPKTGASIKVKAKKVVAIKPTRAVRDYISG